MMSTGAVDVRIFEGIATIELDGDHLDTYMTINTQSIGYTTRWYGSFTWMGSEPAERYDSPTVTRDIHLSDGRTGKIKIPFPAENDKVEFLGIGLPPGFEPFGLDLVQEPVGLTTPSRFRRFLSGCAKTASFLCLVTSIWLGGYHWQLAASAGLFWLTAGLLSIPPRPPKVPRHDIRPPLDIPHA